MMIVSPTPVFRWTDNNGNPAVGWQVETYIAGSSTPVDTYTDATGTAENTNPIILDARGEANIWLDPAISYKYVIKNNLGVVQDTIDQIQAGSGGSGGLTRVYYNDSSSIAFSGLGTLATPLSSSIKLSTQPNNALQIRADGLYAVAIGGGGSVAWGAITGDITDQTDLINKFDEYIKRDGTSTTTATIPFALGATFSDNQALAWSVGSTIRGTGAGNIQVRPWLASNGGFDVLSYVNTFDATTHNILKWNGTTTPPTGTQAYLLGIDANGRIIQGSAGSGFVTISGHNDLTTPWSIGDGTTYTLSNGGIKIDPGGAFGIEMKGNVQIEQAVSQALNLYRPVASGDICLVFRAWDALGTASDYAQVCGRIVTNTTGNLSGALDFEIMVNGTMQTPMILSNTGTVLSLHTSVSGSQISLRSSDTGAGGWRMGIRSTTAGEWILVNDNLATIPLIVSRTDDSFTFAGAVLTSASTTTRAGLRIPHGTAPTTPTNGDLWTTTTAVLARINGTTRTFGLLGVANDWATTQTARAWLTTVQTSTPTGTTYTWTITSGAQLELNLGSSTGNVTITTSLAVSATCVLSVVGHATLSRDVTITQSGVTFIMTGKTSGNSITLDSIPATKRACYTLYFITSTKCFIDRIVLEA